VLPSPRSPERAQGCIRSRDATRLKLATFMSGDGQRVQTFGPRVSGAQALWDSAGGSHPANSAHGWTTARLSTGGPLRPPPGLATDAVAAPEVSLATPDLFC
jgi:hypothetical protein